MSTYSDLLGMLRDRLDEGTANEWTDADLYGYLSMAERWLAGFLGGIRGSGRFRYTENQTLPASTETIALSGLTKAFDRLVSIEMQVSGGGWVPLEPMVDGEDHLYRSPTNVTVSGDVVPYYRLQDDSFVFLPVASSARTLKYQYLWVPAAKTSGASTVETPVKYDDLLVLRAAHFALADAGEKDTSFDEEYASRIAEVEDYECNRSSWGRGERIKFIASRGMFG